MDGRGLSLSLSLNELSIIDTQNGVEKAKARESGECGGGGGGGATARLQPPLSEFGTANNAPHNGVVACPIHPPALSPSLPLPLPLSPFLIKPPCVQVRTVEEWI